MPRAPHAHGAATALPAVWPPALTSELNGSYGRSAVRRRWPAARRFESGVAVAPLRRRAPRAGAARSSAASTHASRQMRCTSPPTRSSTSRPRSGCTSAATLRLRRRAPRSRWRTARSPACAAATSSAQTRRCGSSWCRARASPSTWVGRCHASPERFGAARVGRMHKALVSGDYRNFHKQLRNLTAEEEVEAEVRCFSRRGVPSCFPGAPRVRLGAVSGVEAAVRRLLVFGARDARLGPRAGVCHRAPRPPPLRPRADSGRATSTAAAVRRQSPSCLRAARRIPAVRSAKVVNNCSLPKPPDPGRHGDQWERRAGKGGAAAEAHGLGHHAAVEADARRPAILRRTARSSCPKARGTSRWRTTWRSSGRPRPSSRGGALASRTYSRFTQVVERPASTLHTWSRGARAHELEPHDEARRALEGDRAARPVTQSECKFNAARKSAASVFLRLQWVGVALSGAAGIMRIHNSMH